MNVRFIFILAATLTVAHASFAQRPTGNPAPPDAPAPLLPGNHFVGPINGSASGVCGLANQTFEVPHNPDIQLYTWSVPAGATIVYGQGHSLIKVNFNSNYSSGPVSVTATFSNGIAKATLPVKGAPERPTITPPGPFCHGQEGVYTVTSENTNNYVWDIAPSSLFEPQSTSNQQVYLIWNGGGNIKAVNNCGVSDPLIINGECETKAEGK